MNILITSAGRRVKIIEYFQQSIKKIGGKIVATDCDINAPAIHFADEYEIVPRIDDSNYIETIIDICHKHEIVGVVSLIDPELEILAQHKEKFDEHSIKLILSPLTTIEITFDKYQTYRSLSENNIPSVPTFNSLSQVTNMLTKGEISYPLVVKPAKGSASLGIEIVYKKDELQRAYQKSKELVIQPFYKDKEFGVDVYVDMLTGHPVDLFMKEKIRMRSGETDKSQSLYIEELEQIILKLIERIDFRGPIDVDCFEFKGKYYISEINPRFGGGYPHAYEMGSNFVEYIVKNLQNKVNDSYKQYSYHKETVMMKYDNILLK